MAKYRKDGIREVFTRVYAEIGDITKAKENGFDRVVEDIAIDYKDGYSGESIVLQNHYRENLIDAFNKLEVNVAFPSVGTDSGYPLEVAAEIAIRVVGLFLQSHMETMERIVWICKDEAEKAAYDKALSDLAPKVAWWLKIEV